MSLLRSLAVTTMAATALFSAAAVAQTPAASAPVAKAPEKLKYLEGGMLVLLAPTYPKEALARGETAVVTATGTVQTDGRLEYVRIEASVPNESFVAAVRSVAPLWRMQPRIVPPQCDAIEIESQVSIWFEIEDGKPKVSYGVRPPAAASTPRIYNDRAPIRSVTPQYPARLAADPNMPKSVMQIAYVGVAASGDVINVTLAPVLYYREFEPLIALAIRQWKYKPQESPWCGETVFHMTLE